MYFRPVIAGVFLLAIGVFVVTSLAGSQGYTFTNNAAQPRNDMHLEFEHAVTWAPATPSPFDRASTQGQATVDFGRKNGPSVAAAGQVTVTFTTTGSGPTLKQTAGVSQSYWTHNGIRKETIDSTNCNPFP